MIEIEQWRTTDAKKIELDAAKIIYSVGFLASSSEVDARTSWSEQYIRKICSSLVNVEYSRTEVSLSFNSSVYQFDQLKDVTIPDGRILIDATSLQVPELLHLFRLLSSLKRSFDIMYVQPTEYTKELRKLEMDEVSQFDLSDDGSGAEFLPPYVSYGLNSTLFVCLGFEGHRFGALMNSDSFNSRHITGLMGIPPFAVGMESKSLSSNYNYMLDSMSGRDSIFLVAAANDPLYTYKLIEKSFKSAEYTKRSFCLAPLGTKPAALGSLLFAVNNPRVAVIYDYVKKKKGRTIGTEVIHLWRCSISDSL